MFTRSRAAALLVAAVFAVGALAGCSSEAETGAVTDVTPSEAVPVLAESGVAVIDVRTPAEFAEGHLDGAVNIDLQGGAFDDQLADLPKDTTYVVYCQSDNRSGVATDKMAELGFVDVYDLKGGIIAWQESGGALVAG